MRPPSKHKKLRKGEAVEVRQTEEGLRGAWFEGIVIESHALHRRVKYKNVLAKNGKNALVENIRVSNVIEGWNNADRSRSKKRGCIRPLPPLNTEESWTYGLCVDAFAREGWWEGVLTDNSEHSGVRSVFFPDEGDEIMIPKQNLRVTQDWDETQGRWRVRGCWRLSNLRSFCDGRGFSIKVFWYNVRTHHYFLSKVGEWMHGEKHDWTECLCKVLPLIESDPSRQLIPGLNTPGSQSSLNRKKNFLSGSRGWKNSSQILKSNKTHDSIIERDPSRQLIPGVNAPRTQSSLNRKKRFLSGSRGWKDSSQILKSNKTHDSIIERDPSGQLIPGVNAPVTRSSLNCKKRFLSGSRGWKDSSQILKSNKTLNPSLEEDSNPGAIVCCETVGQELPLNAVVGKDTPIFHSENANDLIGRIGNCFSNQVESSSKENCLGKELPKALRNSSSARRKPCNRVVNEMEQIDCMKNRPTKGLVGLVNTTSTEQDIGHVDKELYRDVAMGASLKDGSKSKQNQPFKSPPCEANSEGQTECIDMRLSKTSNRDQFNSENGSNLPHQISARCKSLTLRVGGNFLRKLNAAHRFKPSATLNREDYSEQDSRAAFLAYNPFSNPSKEMVSKVKAYLHQQDWTFELKPRRSGERKDILYTSPKGNKYYSLHKACKAWRKAQKVERMIDGHCEDVWVKGSVSPSSQETPLRVKRKTSSSRQLVSRSKRLRGDGNKKRSVTCEEPSVSVLTHETQPTNFLLTRETQPTNFLSNSVSRHFQLRNMTDQESNLKRSSQAPLTVSGWGMKKRKLNLEGSMDVQKQKEAKSSCHVWKTSETTSNWDRMPDLPSTPRRSNDSSSCHDKLTDIFSLSWLIENGVVTENQPVFFMHGKEGCLTRNGIFCACCRRVHSLISFEAHAGNKFYQLSVNLRLNDGRTLAQCQMQALRKTMRASSEAKRLRASLMKNKKRAPLNKERIPDPVEEHDDFCFVCRQNGEVTLCDRCTRSFHADCVHPEKIPGTEEWSKWFCPNCRCDKCGGGEFSDDESFTESSVLSCDQCECLFHVGCVDEIGMSKLAYCPEGKWFCSQKCSEIFSQLRNLVGKANPVGNEGLSWTLLRSTEEDGDPSCNEMIAEEHSDPLFYKVKAKKKLSAALSVMHECFSRIKEYRTRKDYVEEIIFNRGCDRNLLKFQGFYTAILEKGGKVISVATVRVHGKRAVEMPLISTRTQYRRKGMCRLLLNELEKLLISLQIEKIVLPAIYQLESTWKRSFGFQEMTAEEMFDLLKLDIVHFPDTTMLQKTLMGVSPKQEMLTEIGDRNNRAEGMHHCLRNIYGLEIQKGIVSEKPAINACKRRSYTEFAESVTPLCSLPGKTYTFIKPDSNSIVRGCFIGKIQTLSKGFQDSGSGSRKWGRIRQNEIKTIECHSGKTPMERDVDESVIELCTTRFNRQVRQVKRKVGYSCHREEHKPMRSVENYLHDRKSCKRRMKDKIIVSDMLPAIPPDTLESLQKKDIQFGTCELRKPADGKTIKCRTDSRIADDNCFSNIEANEPMLDRPVLEHGSDHVAGNRENVSDNSHTVNCNENYRENCRGHLGSQDSFKYVYTRRRKIKVLEMPFLR